MCVDYLYHIRVLQSNSYLTLELKGTCTVSLVRITVQSSISITVSLSSISTTSLTIASIDIPDAHYELLHRLHLLISHC